MPHARPLDASIMDIVKLTTGVNLCDLPARCGLAVVAV
jgi:hypothetical protein